MPKMNERQNTFEIRKNSEDIDIKMPPTKTNVTQYEVPNVKWKNYY